jgi:Mlc titration factor MtfA (ptsG expression regulator)
MIRWMHRASDATLGRWRRWSRQRELDRFAIADALWQANLARFPFLARRSDEDRAALRILVSQFLARKEFSGANGLSVTDEMAVAIASQACLPVLRLGLGLYDGWVGIVVHPDHVVARREHLDDDGVLHEYDEPLAGEAMAGGPVMLTWSDVADAGAWAEEGYNVVIHEFAHILDMRTGEADGTPPMPTAAARQQWQRVLLAAYAAFCDDVAAGLDTVIDPYGAEAPEEFFAVAVEAFFVIPADLRSAHPALYALFRNYFSQDPAEVG